MPATPASAMHSQPSRRLVADLTDADVGHAIRDRRQHGGLHQDALAAIARIDPKVLSRIERGERPCRVAELSTIAAALNITGPELLQRTHLRHDDPAAATAA